jgi:subtilisin family serine protease
MLRIFLKLFLIIPVSFYLHTTAALGTKEAKIHKDLLNKLQSSSLDKKAAEQTTYNILVHFPSVASSVFGSDKFKRLRGAGDRKARDEFTHYELSAATAESQKSFQKALNTLLKISSKSAKVETFWITNAISIQNLDAKDIFKIAEEFPGEFYIAEPIQLQALPLLPINPLPTPTCSQQAVNGSQWGRNAVNAPAAQTYGNGSGVTVFIIDSGIYTDHEAFAV